MHNAYHNVFSYLCNTGDTFNVLFSIIHLYSHHTVAIFFINLMWIKEIKIIIKFDYFKEYCTIWPGGSHYSVYGSGSPAYWIALI